MHTQKSRLLLVANLLLIVVVAAFLSGCNLGKEECTYADPTFEVMYTEATDTSDVMVTVTIANNGHKALETATFKCYFLDAAENTLDIKEQTFTLKIDKDSQKNCVLTFTAVQGKPQDINLVSVGATYGGLSFGGFLAWVWDWLMTYGYIILLIIIFGSFAIGGIVALCRGE